MPTAALPSATVAYTDFNPTPVTVCKTVVFIHGLGSSQNFYAALPYTLRAQDRRYIILDSPGSARSPLPAGDALTVRSLAATVLQLLDHLGATKNVTVVGHSMGCLVALHLAQLTPERVDGLVLLGPVYPSTGLAEVFAKRIPAVRKDGMESMAAIVPNTAVGSKATPLQRAFIRELLLGQTAEGYAALCGAIATATVGELEKVKAKVLIVAGSEDRSAPMDGCKKYLEELPRVELTVLEGVGHWHVIEAADEVSKLVDAFVGV